MRPRVRIPLKPRILFFGLFRNCLNCDSVRWSHTQFICIPTVHMHHFILNKLMCWFRQSRESITLLLRKRWLPIFDSMLLFIVKYKLSLWNSRDSKPRDLNESLRFVLKYSFIYFFFLSSIRGTQRELLRKNRCSARVYLPAGRNSIFIRLGNLCILLVQDRHMKRIGVV